MSSINKADNGHVDDLRDRLGDKAPEMMSAKERKRVAMEVRKINHTICWQIYQEGWVTPYNIMCDMAVAARFFGATRGLYKRLGPIVQGWCLKSSIIRYISWNGAYHYIMGCTAYVEKRYVAALTRMVPTGILACIGIFIAGAAYVTEKYKRK